MKRWLIVPWKDRGSVAGGGYVTLEDAVLVVGEKAILQYARSRRGIETDDIEEVFNNLKTGGYEVVELA